MKETKTVQVYPSDDIVNSTIEEFESFGWEVISNQRCQELDGSTRDLYDGSVTNHYSTFNKITFTREKESAWYEDVSAIEKEYNSVKDTVRSYRACAPVLKKPKPTGGWGIGLGAFLYVMYIVPGIIYSIIRAIVRGKYKKVYQKELSEYNAVYPAKMKEAEEKLALLRVDAEKRIRIK